MQISLLKPGLRDSVFKNVTRQVLSRFETAECSFDIGTRVMMRDYSPGHSRWQPARVLAKLGNKSYRVETDGGGVWKRHADQMTATHIENGIVDTHPLRNQTDNCVMGSHAVQLPLGMDGQSRNQHATQIQMSE